MFQIVDKIIVYMFNTESSHLIYIIHRQAKK